MSYASEVAADSPVIWLKLDEASGSFADSGSSGTAFTAAASVSYQQSPLVLDGLYSVASGGSGVGYRTSVPASLAGDNVSQEVWFNMPSGNQKGTLTHLGASSAGWGFGIGNGSSTDVAGRKLTVLIAGVAFYDSGHTFSDGLHHVVMTHTTTNNFVIYVDGTQVFSGTFGTPPSASARVSVGLLDVGGQYELSSGIKVDHAAFYASVLSSTRVSAHYNAGITSGIINGGLATEADTTFAGTVNQTIHGGIATEADSALAGAMGSFVPLGLAVETDATSAGSLVVGSVISGGVAIELDTALPLVVPVLLGQASETDVALAGEIVLGYSPTDTSNRVGGRDRQGYGVATWEPAVVAPPATVTPVHVYEKAHAFSEPTITNGRPAYTVTEVKAKAHRPRILVGGKDVTYFRNVPTPAPSYRLVEPLDYGAGTLELPQVSPAFETLGTGSLKWLKKGKRVIVQRVNVDTGAVVATDYRGFISDFSVRGNSLVCELGGEVSGRAALMDKQPPIFRTVLDVGWRLSASVRRVAPVKFRPRLPTTGIEIASQGGMSELDHLNELAALATTVGGDQYTVGRRDDGSWGVWLKDTTTIDATIYLDDARMVADLHESLAEEPNRIFMTGVNPDGQRVKFGAYPGLRQGDPPPYPFNDGRTFSQGTTNAQTDTGDGISVMIAHLYTMGYLTLVNYDGGYDADATRGIKRLQDDAGLTESGNMNPATWDALFDISSTGYSLRSSRILPAVQRSTVKPWRLSASGAKVARNPNYDPHKVKVDRSVNVGSGFTRQQMRDWAREDLREANTPNWVGTITCHLSAIEGEHNPGDPLTASMLMPARAIKPGMNVWLPLFDGGTLVHVSGAEVPSDGPVVLTVDTRARDTMAAWEAITRNRESRANPARAWLNQHRSSMVAKDAFIEWDEISGVLDEQVRLAGGTWTVVPVLAGQAGTVGKIRLHMADDVRFAVSVTARKISAARMNHLVPNPLTEAGSEKWDKQAVRNALDERGWVYQAGRFEQRCGYWPGVETGDDGEPSGDPITGKWEDDAGAGYHTFAEPVLYVAIWVESATRLRAGRIMWNQLEAGA